MAHLLRDDEAGWYEAARWIDRRSLEEGIDLYASLESPESFSASLVEAIKFRTNFQQRLLNGIDDLKNYETAEELFWSLLTGP